MLEVFLKFPFKAKFVENLISSGVENHTFGRKNLREHFLEEHEFMLHRVSC